KPLSWLLVIGCHAPSRRARTGTPRNGSTFYSKHFEQGERNSSTSLSTGLVGPAGGICSFFTPNKEPNSKTRYFGRNLCTATIRTPGAVASPMGHYLTKRGQPRRPSLSSLAGFAAVVASLVVAASSGALASADR